jgi:hypothetical protein
MSGCAALHLKFAYVVHVVTDFTCVVPLLQLNFVYSKFKGPKYICFSLSRFKVINIYIKRERGRREEET